MALAGVTRHGGTGPEVWLAHLSDTNNRPTLAEATVREALARSDVDLRVSALPRREPGPVWVSGPLSDTASASRYIPFEEPRQVADGPTQLGFDGLAGF